MYDINKISAEDFLELINTDYNHQIVDVNENPLQFDLCKDVFHIPFSKLEEQVEKLDKHRPILLMCRFGEKSFFGAAMLRHTYGFQNVISLTGGFEVLNDVLEERKNS